MGEQPFCRIERCGRPVRVKNVSLCTMHWRRWKRFGDPGGPDPLPKRRVQVERCLTTDGYVRLRKPGHPMAQAYGWVLEHRLVAFDLGLLAGPSDRRHVHHINHDRSDNRPENLSVLSAAAHSRAHRTIQWGRAPSLYASGMSTVEVAAVLGTHAGNVSRRLREMGVTMRRTAHNRVNLDEDAVMALAHAGEPWAAIARHFGVSRMPIERILRARGVQPRRAGRPRVAA